MLRQMKSMVELRRIMIFMSAFAGLILMTNIGKGVERFALVKSKAYSIISELHWGSVHESLLFIKAPHIPSFL